MSLFIRMLTPDDSSVFVDHLVRDAMTVDADALPLSSPFPRNHKIDAVEKMDSAQRNWVTLTLNPRSDGP